MRTRLLSCAQRARAVRGLHQRVLATPGPPLQVPDGSITDALWDSFDRWPERTAVVCSETGRSYTYGRVQRLSEQFGRALRWRLGLPRGAVLAVMLPNVPEYAVSVLGALHAGLVVSPVNPAYSGEEVARQLRDSGARALVSLAGAGSDALDMVARAAPAGGPAAPVVTVRHRASDATPAGCVDLAELCAAAASTPSGAPHFDPAAADPELALLPYSSGTTGLPKGVELTHRNILANMAQTAALDQSVWGAGGAGEQPVVPAVLPLFHIYGLCAILFKVMMLGGRLVTVPRFAPDTFADMLLQHRPHSLFVVPPIVLYMGAHAAVSRRHLDSVVNVVSGAAPLGAADVERLLTRAGHELRCMQGYGLTESSPAISFTSPDHWRRYLGAVGAPLPGTECLLVPPGAPDVDDAAAAAALAASPGLPAGQSGELLVRGPQVMRRYHDRPEDTARTLLPGGWLRTGDVAYYDDAGVLWLTDRLKELIKVKGFQVAPAELEEVVRQHPAVADAAVVGVPHGRLGEAPRAFVVVRPGVPPPSERDVQEFVAARVAAYKRLEGGVVLLDAIPKTASGKIMRRTLRDQSSGGGS